MHRLVFPRKHFLLSLHELSSNPQRVIRCLVGTNHLDQETHYLVRRVEVDETQLSARDRQSSILVSMENADGLPTFEGLGYLYFAKEVIEGSWHGWVKTAGEARKSLDCIQLVGAGMYTLKSSNARDSSTSVSNREVYRRFSRTIAAIGFLHWRRLTALRIAVIGCGRSGSVAAVTLAKLGVQSLTLIDPDVVEAHNIAEMDGVTEADIGRLKVDVLAEYLRSHCASAKIPLQINPIGEPITEAYQSPLASDVLFCCVDNDAARLACAILATLNHKVLIDIGTGINHDSEKGREMGIDVRLILPGEGCLHCFGNVANYDEALTNLILRNRPNDNRNQPWWVQRGGSLRSLNMMAISLGVQMLCDLVAERINDSRWVRIEIDDKGSFSIEQPNYSTTLATEDCPLCAKSGLGEGGLLW